MTEEDNSSKTDEYFTWEPEEKTLGDKSEYNENGIKVVYFGLNQNYIDLDKIIPRGRLIKGLAKIILKDDSSEIESSSRKYTIKFEGRINADDLDESEKPETEQALRKHYSDISRDCMRKKREAIYNKQVKKYFPRKELSKKLPEIVESNEEGITVGTFRRLVNSILNENGVAIKEINKIAYNSSIWTNVIDEFMQEQGYFKKKSKYFLNSAAKEEDKRYDKQVKRFFPRKELEKRLPAIMEYKTNNIPVGAFRRLINNILNEKGVSIKGHNTRTYNSSIWNKTVNEFMAERDYVKEGNKYVPIKK